MNPTEGRRRMKREVTASAVLVVLVLIGLLAAAIPAEAAKTYDEHSLNGTYYYTVVQVREAAPPASGTEYCSGWGTVDFHGDGTALIEGYDRCSVEGTNWNSEAHAYSVSASGEVFIWRTADPSNVTHCQVLDKGKMLMCDGIDSTPDVLSYHAVAVRQ
jgi:hypothetical protein